MNKAQEFKMRYVSEKTDSNGFTQDGFKGFHYNATASNSFTLILQMLTKDIPGQFLGKRPATPPPEKTGALGGDVTFLNLLLPWLA